MDKIKGIYKRPETDGVFCVAAEVLLSSMTGGPYDEMIGGDPEGFVENNQDW
jgi:hypothetical protein